MVRKLSNSKILITLTGLATFFFGFGAGAILNYYLISINSPLVKTLRATLTYRSAIIGDGFILPIINMVIVSFLLKNKTTITKKILISSLVIGFLITAAFHIDQALKNLVNWSMPTPWHWNLLGLWHAIYMLIVSSLISLFFLTAIKIRKSREKYLPSVLIVIVSLITFLILLGTDYM